MLLGALVDAGAAEAAIRKAVGELHLPECDLRFERVMRGALSALQATVMTPRRETPRHFADLAAVVSAADLPDRLRAEAHSILRRLAEVEAGIHNAPIESVHLHELGGDDTLIDIVGVLTALDDLQIEHVYVSPLPLARGWTKSMHGSLPLPAPATLALLKDVPIRYVDNVEAELVTPTGAVLLTRVATNYGGFPLMTLRSIGVGAGRREMPFPNVVRVWIGEAAPSNDGLIIESLSVLETNVDDMNPQIYEHVMNRLLASGALDVTLTSIQMKKSRPGTMLSVLCRPADADALLKIVFAETTTLGVRRSSVERVSLPRAIETVETPYGSIRVKVARWNGIDRAMPEYEDCRRAAETHQVPIAEVMAAARVPRHSANRQ